MASPTSQGGIDYPDGGFTGGVGLYSLIGDLAELAARLWSPVTFNREGCIVFMDSFEHGLPGWEEGGAGTGNEVIISAVNARSLGYSCKLVAGSDGTRTAALFKSFATPQQCRYGIEFSLHPDEDVEKVYVYLYNRTEETLHFYAWQYVASDHEVQIRDSDGTWQTALSDVYMALSYYGFSTVKMVVDLVAPAYDRILINDREVDISDYTPAESAGSLPSFMYTNIGIIGASGENATCYVDDVILTRNEPARREV